MHYTGSLHSFWKFFLLGLHFLTNLQFLKPFVNFCSLLSTVFAFSKAPDTQTHTMSKSDGQDFEGSSSISHLTPHILFSFQFTIPIINSGGKLGKEMSCKLHYVLAAMKSSLSNALKGNRNI